MALYVEQHWGNTAKARRKREQNFATHSHLGNGNVETERYKYKKTSVEKVEKSVEGFMSRTENGEKNFFNVKANRGAHKKLRLQITAGWSDPAPLFPLSPLPRLILGIKGKYINNAKT